MANRKKERLTELEMAKVRDWMNSAPPGRKPSIRLIAKRFRRTRPTIVKSLGDWKRDKPKRLIPKVILGSNFKPKIEPFTTK